MDYLFKLDFGNGFVTVAPPVNHAAIKLDIIFTSQKPSASIQSINFEWIGETAKSIIKYKNQGMTGGRGIGECIPMQIVPCYKLITSGGVATIQVDFKVDLMLDLGSDAARFECDRVQCPILQSGRIDWLSVAAESVSYWYLASANVGGGVPGKINYSDYKKTPYCINFIPDGMAIVTLLLTEFMVVWQLAELIRGLKERVEALVVYVAQTAIITSGAILQLIFRIIEIVAYLIYIFFLLKLFIQLIKDIADNILKPFPPKKIYKLCMREEDIWIRTANYFGLNFSSTIYAPGSPYRDATEMPQKIVMPAEYQPFNLLSVFDRPYDENGNQKSYGHPDGTCKEFMERMMIKYNAEIRIDNNTLYFEERHFWDVTDPYQIPNVDEIGYTFNLPDPHGTNFHELPPSYLLKFQMDTSDLNTVHFYKGTSIHVMVNPIIVGNVKYLTNGQAVWIELPYALAKRKQFLNPIEQRINSIINGMNGFISVMNQFVTTVIGTLNAVIQFFGGDGFDIPQIGLLQTLDNRIGWMELSNDSFTIPKTFIGTNVGGDWELHPDSQAIMSAVGLFNNFHGKQLATRGNQYITYFDKRFGFCCTDVAKIIKKNVLITPDNKKGKFTKLSWWLENELAEGVDYRIRQDFTTNLKETIIIDSTR